MGWFESLKNRNKHAGKVEDRTDPEVNLGDLDLDDLVLSGSSTSDGPRESFANTMKIHDGSSVYSGQLTAREASIIATDYNAMKEKMNEEEEAKKLGEYLYRKCQDNDISLSAIPPELEEKWKQEYYAMRTGDDGRTAADDSRTDDDGRTAADDSRTDDDGSRTDDDDENVLLL